MSDVTEKTFTISKFSKIILKETDIENPAEMKKRSVVISGHQTSVSLENVFWETIKEIAARQNKSLNQLITEIDSERNGNLSSAIRVYALLNAKAVGD